MVDFAPWNVSPMSNNQNTLTTATIKTGIVQMDFGSAGFGAFSNCDNLKTIFIPQKVSDIEKDAFKDITPFTTIYCETQAVKDLIIVHNAYNGPTPKYNN